MKAIDQPEGPIVADQLVLTLGPDHIKPNAGAIKTTLETG